ncbi:MAG: hypothetical protein KY469_09060 [Actinobacteria bacterium]|nr:hypothetical protein [Actinomycetota bacterium]
MIRAWAGVAACLAALVVGVVPAAAQPERATEAGLYLAGLDGIIGPGTVPSDAEAPAADLRLRLLVENEGVTDLEDLRLSVEVFERARFRSTLHGVLDVGDRIALLHSTIIDIADGSALQVGDVQGVAVTRPEGEMPWATAPGTTAVYPVVLTLLQGAAELDRVATAVVYLAEPVTEPLHTTFVWPLNEPPWRLPGDVYPPDVDVSIRPGGRLDTLLRIVERSDAPEVLLAPAAHLLEDLQDRADGFTVVESDGTRREVSPSEAPAVRSEEFLSRLRAVGASTAFEPVAGSYADADVAALAAAPPPLDSEAGTATSQGRRRLDDALERRPDPATFWVTTPVNRPVLDVLVENGIEHLLLPANQVTYPHDLANYPELPNPVRALTTPRGRRLTTTVPDPYLDQVVLEPDPRHGPTVAAQRLLAETAVLWGERPNAPGRALAIHPPLDWAIDGPLAAALYAAAHEAPWLRLTDPAGQLASSAVPPAPATLRERPTNLSLALEQALVSARADLATLLEAIPGELDDRIAGREVTALERQLLRAPSIWYRGGATGTAMVEDVMATVARAFGEIDVPTGARITLTSESGTIPVTIQRRTGDPLQVLVTLESRASLRWTEGQEEVITFEQPGVRTLAFPVRVAAPGSFGVIVTVTDVTGSRLLATGTIPVRSTAISGPAIIGTVVVVLVLLMIGLWRRSRPSRPRLEVVNRERV